MIRMVVLACVLTLIFGTLIFAQTNDEGLAFLQFNFLNPGARALAMGGAFVGLADDATASQSNPAGLITLIAPEISFEYSSTNQRNRIPWHSGSMTITTVSKDPLIETEPSFSLRASDFPERVSDPSFLSFVYPVAKSYFVLAGFFNKQSNYRRDFQTQGVDIIFRNEPDSGKYFFPTSNSLEFDINNIGLAAAYSPHRKLNLGLSLISSSLVINHRTERTTREPQIVKNIESLTADDRQFAYSAGIQLKPTGKVSVGLVYNWRPTFNANSKFEAASQAAEEKGRQFHIPNSYGFGVSLQPNDKLTINADLVRINYSQLMDGYYEAFHRNSFDGQVDDDRFEQTTLEVEDGTEYRAGMEYVFQVMDNPLALRGGYWREPFHSIIQTRDDALLIDNLLIDSDISPFQLRSFKEELNHATVGIGYALKRFSLDFGYDHSKTSKRFVGSTIFYFR